MTTVINLLGSPSTGKSTLACELFAKMKYQGYNVELVREVAKELAWEGRVPTAFDQMYIIGEQIKRESSLYGKVDYIITDSPIILGGFYMEYNHKEKFMTPMIKEFYNFSQTQNIMFLNYFLSRTQEYCPKGRFQTEEEAKLIDTALEIYVAEHLGYDKLELAIECRADYILETICHVSSF